MLHGAAIFGSGFVSTNPETRVTRRAFATGVLATIVAVFVMLVMAPRSAAQTELAGVSGRITDQSGAVIVDAEVEIKNVETNVSTTVKTNKDGLYTIPSLRPGHYLINVRRPGFKSVTVTEVELNIQDNVVRNFALQLGSITETVTVNGNDINLNTTNGAVSTVVDETYIKNMPLNGRSFQDLILLTPGTVTQSPQASKSGAFSTVGASGEFSVNGQRTESNYYTVDGVSANVGIATGSFAVVTGAASGSVPASTVLGTTQALVSVDALQEFRVQSSTYSAEYGRNPGGQFAFETKSGTNQWHGTAYDYLRNGVFDAQDWFSDYFGKPAPSVRQNDFGGTLGGPVRIPGLYNGKDKTFFFVSYEGLRLIAPQAAGIRNVPDTALRASAPSPLNQALNAFPVQSPAGIDDTASGIAQFIGTWSNPASVDSTSVRFDHVVNDKLRLFFRFGDTDSASAIRAGSTLLPPSMVENRTYTIRNYTTGVSGVLSSHLANEFRLNYTSNETADHTVIDAFGGSTPVSLAELSGLNAGSFVNIILVPGGHLALLNESELTAGQRQWNLVDTASLAVGRQQFKFGVDYRRLSARNIQPPVVNYVYVTNSSISNNKTTVVSAHTNAPAYPLYTNFSAFAQDDWRVSQRLSVSLGLRWEVNPAPGVTQGVEPYTVQGSNPSTWTLAPQGTPLWQTTWFNFAPRLGAAYVLHQTTGWETVVRGGGGVFFDTGQQQGSVGFYGPGLVAFKTTLGGSFPGAGPGLVPSVVNPPVVPYSATPSVFPAHLQLPFTLQWNSSIEQGLGKSQSLTVSYVGSRGTRLLQESNLLTPSNPNAGEFVIITNGGRSYYGALQAQFRRRLSRGLTTLASYTWSHCIDYGSQDYFLAYQRGNCDFDIRHNLSTAFSYDLPNVGPNPFLKAIFNHWGFDDRFTARTAFPVPLQGNLLFDPVTGEQYYGGLNLVPGQPVYLYGSNCASVLQGLNDLKPGQGCPGGRAINPQAFTSVSSGLGTAPRNFVRGFGAWQMDLAVRRDFPIFENLKLQFRAEAFNIFNHPNFGTINSSLCSGTGCTFGQATSTLANSHAVLSSLYQLGGSRSMQFSLRLAF